MDWGGVGVGLWGRGWIGVGVVGGCWVCGGMGGGKGGWVLKVAAG